MNYVACVAVVLISPPCKINSLCFPLLFCSGTVEDTELVEGLVLNQKAAGNTKKVEKAKIGLIQFCISPPKTDMDNQVAG